jgi:hypothetical protein
LLEEEWRAVGGNVELAGQSLIRCDPDFHVNASKVSEEKPNGGEIES